MENRCINTKLKSVTSKDILKLGELRLVPYEECSLTIYSNSNVTVKDLDGTYAVASTEINTTLAANHRISIVKKYPITVIITNYHAVIDCKEINAMPSLTQYNGSMSGTLKFEVNETLHTLSIRGNNLNGNIQELSKLHNLSRLYIISGGHDLYGNIAELGSLTRLSVIQLSTCTELHGTIEDFVRNARSVGMQTGSRNCINFSVPNITFNNSKIHTDNTYLEWTANTITFDGVTINA